MLTAPILLRYLALFVPGLATKAKQLIFLTYRKTVFSCQYSKLKSAKNDFLLEMMKFVKLKAVVSDMF